MTTRYTPSLCGLARNYCLLGATDEELAAMFAVAPATIARWRAEHPDFAAAIAAGRDKADANVARRLYRRAIGYSHKAVRIFGDSKSGAQLVVPYTEHYPPDVAAATFWLKARRPDKWRDPGRPAADPVPDAAAPTPSVHVTISRPDPDPASETG